MSNAYPHQKPRILVVAPEQDFAGMLQRLLADTCEVTLADSGEQALRLAADPPGPDLLLLDWTLPGTGGAAVCRALKAAPSTAAIPVIFVAGDSDLADEVQVFDAGAVDYIRKPLNPPVVMARVRMHLEQAEKRLALRQRGEQLEALNREMEAFSYSVSHDLRAPLRAIRGFSQALQEECSDQLDEPGRDYLQRVLAAAQRMDELIVDILALSRVSRSQFETETVDLSKLVRTTADTICQRHPRPDITVSVQDNLEVQGDARLLRIALENLLENACKFTLHSERPTIEFGMRPEDGMPVYFVRDNGAGFDPRYADKLFVPFQRLHNSNDYPGTGIGLATVQRVINRHGGRIWGKSGPGQGAEFCFTLGPG